MKTWHFQTVVLGKTLESPLDCKIKPVSQFWRKLVLNIHWRADVSAETPILWPLDAKDWLIWKDPSAGKDWRREEKRTTEEEMIRRHHCCDGHEFESTPGTGDGQGGLVCCSRWGHKELDMTERLNWTEGCIVKGVISTVCYLWNGTNQKSVKSMKQGDVFSFVYFRKQ